MCVCVCVCVCVSTFVYLGSATESLVIGLCMTHIELSTVRTFIPWGDCLKSGKRLVGRISELGVTYVETEPHVQRSLNQVFYLSPTQSCVLSSICIIPPEVDRKPSLISSCRLCLFTATCRSGEDYAGTGCEERREFFFFFFFWSGIQLTTLKRTPRSQAAELAHSQQWELKDDFFFCLDLEQTTYLAADITHLESQKSTFLIHSNRNSILEVSTAFSNEIKNGSCK
jgi:hypothetical protein